MGRTGQKLKPFICESLAKGYKNLRELENGVLELQTPRHKKDLDPAFELLFKAYDTCMGRKYQGYIRSKETLKAAIRQSKFFEFISNKENIFLFRQRTQFEIKNTAPKKDEGTALDASPASSGYVSGEGSLLSFPMEEQEVLDASPPPSDTLFGGGSRDALPLEELEALDTGPATSDCIGGEVAFPMNLVDAFDKDLIEFLLSGSDGTHEGQSFTVSTETFEETGTAFPSEEVNGNEITKLREELIQVRTKVDTLEKENQLQAKLIGVYAELHALKKE